MIEEWVKEKTIKCIWQTQLDLLFHPEDGSDIFIQNVRLCTRPCHNPEDSAVHGHRPEDPESKKIVVNSLDNKS
jgi:hypothetical protein